ncbi:hypothetical protein SprV_1002914400 [Sparganum proliferum]
MKVLTKASAFGVLFGADDESLLASLRRLFALPKRPVHVCSQFSSRLQIPRESARDGMRKLRPPILAAITDQHSTVTDVVLTKNFRAELYDNNLRWKLLKKTKLSSESLQEYEERYGSSVSSTWFSASVRRHQQTRFFGAVDVRKFHSSAPRPSESSGRSFE